MPLTYGERQVLEKHLQMNDGYVLDFTDKTFKEFFATHEIYIYNDDYNISGNSKAKRMRAFWENATDKKIATILQDLLLLMKNGKREVSSIIDRLQKENGMPHSSNCKNTNTSDSNKIEAKSINQSTVNQTNTNILGNSNTIIITNNYSNNTPENILFDKIAELAQTIENNDKMLQSIASMRETVSTDNFTDKYKEFMSTISNHITVFNPILCELSRLL